VQIEQVVPDGSLLRSLIGKADRPWTTSALGVGSYRPARYGGEPASFQQKLQEGQRLGLTLREFEKRLAVRRP
jgi:hypothetical protein